MSSLSFRLRAVNDNDYRVCNYTQPCESGMYCSTTGYCDDVPSTWTDQLYQSLNTPYKKWDIPFYSSPKCKYTSLKFNSKDWTHGQDGVWSKNGVQYRHTIVQQFPVELFEFFALEDVITEECTGTKEDTVIYLIWMNMKPMEHVGEYGVLPFKTIFQQLQQEDPFSLEYFTDEFIEKAIELFERVNEKIQFPLANLQDHLVFVGSLDHQFSFLFNTTESTEMDRMYPIDKTIEEFINYVDHNEYIQPSFRLGIGSILKDEEITQEILDSDLFISKLEDMIAEEYKRSEDYY